MNEFPILLYTTPEGAVKVNAVLKDESLWLTQGAMAELFGVQKAAISKHLKNIFAEGELDEGVVVSKMETTTPHGAIAGKTQEHAVNFYNLDAIIAADARAAEEYDAYNRQLKFESDFDKQIKRFLDGSGPRAREVPPDDTPSC